MHLGSEGHWVDFTFSGTLPNQWCHSAIAFTRFNSLGNCFLWITTPSSPQRAWSMVIMAEAWLVISDKLGLLDEGGWRVAPLKTSSQQSLQLRILSCLTTSSVGFC